MQPIVDASWLTPGMIVYHQPRNHFYKLLHRTMIKAAKESGKSWEYGWSYQKVIKEGENTFVGDLDSEIYSRPDSLFDSDWHLAY